MSQVQDLTVDISQSIEINAPIDGAWEALVRRIAEITADLTPTWSLFAE